MFPSSLVRLSAFFLLISVVAVQSATDDKMKIFDAGAQQWKRTPEWMIPQVATAPQIDGQVNRAEWLGAAEIGPFKVGTEGAADELIRRVWICHDEKNIYIAFSIERPVGARAPVLPEKIDRIDEANKLSDAVEMMFAPQLNFNKSYGFWIFANGAFGDAQLNRSKDLSWNPEWQKNARVTEVGWEGEASISFASFGLSGSPSENEWWGFDFVDNRATPYKLASHWSYRGNVWHNYENFGRIRFGKDPAVRLARIGETSGGQNGVELEFANTGSQNERVKVSAEILKHKSGEQAGPKSYYDNIESGVSHDKQAEFTKDATLVKMIEFAESFYEPIPSLAKKEAPLDIPANQRRVIGVGGKLSFGEYLARYRVENTAGQLLAAGTSVFRIEPPLSLRAEPYWLYSQVVDIFTDLTKTGLQGDGELIFKVLPGDGIGEPLRTLTRKVSGSDREVKSTIDVKGLAPAFYRIQCRLLDKSGKELATNMMSIERPAFPAWYRNNHGNKIVVPEPWTPLEEKNPGVLRVWAREYDLTQVFPRMVTSQGKPVLSDPVRLITETSTGPVDWKVETLRLKEKNAAKAVYDVTLQGSGLKLTGSMRVEFDGLIWYDLKLSATSPVDVKSMTLEIPVRSEFCELMGRHKFLEDPVIQTQLPKPELNGAPGLLEDAKLPFTPYLWIGNEQAGMGFMAEAPMNWSIDAPNRVLETKKATAGTPGKILAHIIQKARTIEKPLVLQFGLQATPIRPAPKDRSILNIFQWMGVRDTEDDFAKLEKLGGKVVVFYYNWRGNSKSEMGGTPERPVDPAQQEKLKQAVRLAHKHGLKVILFTGWGVNAVSENWKKFSYELGKYPIQNQGWGTFAQSAGSEGAYVDFMAWGHADLAQEYGVDGVLWDSGANISADQNLNIGNAWVDEQGRTHPKYALLATRDLYRRIYNIYKGEVAKDGVIYNHCGSLWPINVFADLQNRGEGRPMRAATLRESWTPFEEFRAEYSGEPFGSIHTGEINDWEKLPMRVSTHLAVTLLHGTYAKEYYIPPDKRYRTYDYEGRPVMALWETFGWLPMDGTEKALFYYQNAQGHYQAVKALPASLLSSAFVSGDGQRAIVVVSNLETKAIPEAEVLIDPLALGMKSLGAVKIQDGVTGVGIPIENGKVKIAIDQQRYRVLQISQEAPAK